MSSLTFDPNVSVGHIVLACGFVATTSGLALNYHQFRRSNRRQQLDNLYRITHDLFSNDDLREFYYKIDYERFGFVPTAFKGSEDERHLDALLFRYDLIGRLVRDKMIRLRDMSLHAFEIYQVMNNPEVRKYLDWLASEYDNHSKLNQQVNRKPFADADWLLGKLSQQSEGNLLAMWNMLTQRLRCFFRAGR